MNWIKIAQKLTYKIERDTQGSGEYVVCFYLDGKSMGESTNYYTDDKQDAIETGEAEVLRFERNVAPPPPPEEKEIPFEELPEYKMLSELYEIGYANPINGAEVIIGNIGVTMKFVSRKQSKGLSLDFIRKLDIEENDSYPAFGANAVLRLIHKLADKHGVEVRLFPQAVTKNMSKEEKKKALTTKQLRKWYSLHGYEKIPGSSDNMVRTPVAFNMRRKVLFSAKKVK